MRRLAKFREGFVSAEEAGERLGVSVRTLQSWRKKSMGPRVWAYCGRICYKVEDLEAWGYSVVFGGEGNRKESPLDPPLLLSPIPPINNPPFNPPQKQGGTPPLEPPRAISLEDSKAVFSVNRSNAIGLDPLTTDNLLADAAAVAPATGPLPKKRTASSPSHRRGAGTPKAIAEAGGDQRGDHPPSSPLQTARERNPLWDALVAVFYEPSTPQARSLFGKVVSQLKAAGATAAMVADRASRYRAEWPGVELSPTSLLKHWDRFGGVSTAPVAGDPYQAVLERARKDREALRKELTVERG